MGGGDAKFTPVSATRIEQTFVDRGLRTAASASASASSARGATAKGSGQAPQGVSAVASSAAPWMKAGANLEITNRIVYKSDGSLFELPPGLRGTVIRLDEEGDSEIAWDSKTGITTTKWLLKGSFGRVKQVDPDEEA